MLKQLSSSNWSASQASHLLNRAGFGGSPSEVAALQAKGLEGAVDFLITGDEESDLFPLPYITPPDKLAEEARLRQGLPEMEKREAFRKHRQEQGMQVRALRGWWLNRMRYTTFPLREKLTLFWHSHFATGYQKVNITYKMWQQNETLRANALGSFRTLTKEVAKDPAMMRYLDTDKSEKTKPNENFARELMELFTLGEGVVYTENDIRESARAFTGYRVSRQTQQFQFLKSRFDSSEKNFLGRKGPFNGDDIIDIILQQPECAEYIARKLWVYFASDSPSDATIEALANHFQKSDYDISSTLKEMFLCEEFYSPSVVRQQVKSPVQWLVQTARVLEAPLPGASALEAVLPQMGQRLFDPPNVKGWDGGRSWISSSTLLLRYNMAGYIVSGKLPALGGFQRTAGIVDIPLNKIAPPDLRANPEKLCDVVSARLVNGRLGEGERQKLITFLKERGTIDDPAVRDFLHLMMSTPEYQLT